MSDFIHLHNHTDYSLLDAAQSIDMMSNRLSDIGMDTIAVTEHGNLFSMIPFYKQARETGIKPIIGCEIYVAVNKHTDKKQIATSTGKKWGYNHLVLLVQNKIGYNNLMKLVSIGYLEGFYYRPRVDKALLRKYNEGLICTSACLAGEITQFAGQNDYESAKKAALEYAEIFSDRFYIEIQNHQIPEEIAAHSPLKKLSEELNIPLVATNDCHYALREHWEAHDVLFCLGTSKDRNDPNRHRYEPRQFYIKSADEMLEATLNNLPTDVAIFSAAVADFKVKNKEKEKIKKNKISELFLEKNTDILGHISNHNLLRPKLVVGFAAETNSLKNNSLKKLSEKNCDWIIANDISKNDIGFESDFNKVSIFYKNNSEENLPKMRKSSLANEIVNRIISQLN